MSRYICQGTTRDGNGRVIVSATVSVYLTGTSTVAKIYTASSGGTEVNSVTSDSLNGYFYFWVDDSDYLFTQLFRLVLSKDGYETRTWDNVAVLSIPIVTWGTITGSLAAQSDLAAVLAAMPTLTGSETLTHKDLTSVTNTFPTFNQNTSGTAAGLSAVSALPNGTTATTQAASDNSTKVATTAQVQAAIAANTSNVPTGAIFAFPVSTPPTGYLECSGAAVSKTTYAALYTFLKDGGATCIYGESGGNFNLPDFRGKFMRGWDHTAGNDPDAATRTNRGDSTTGDYVGTKQSGQLLNHYHTANTGLNAWTIYTGTGGAHAVASSGSEAILNATMESSGGGNETRPININIMYCIKY